MDSVGTCSNEGCQIANGGNCLEGFEDLSGCPNYSADNEGLEIAGEDLELGTQELSEDLTSVDASTEKSEVAALRMPSGNALAAREAHRLAGERPSTVVMLAGMVGSGKTTVLAELYERFRTGPFAGYMFAGSRTLMGFEQVCHLARAASEREHEDTLRTRHTAENNLLHLDLVHQDSEQRARLLLTDLSGELFDRAAGDSRHLHAIPYLQRADHLVIFADSEKLCDLSERQVLLNKLIVLLRSCVEEAVFEPSCRLTIAVSRHDVGQANIDSNFIASMRERVIARVSPYFIDAPCFIDLAARPTGGPSESYGLEELLLRLLENRARPVPHTPSFDQSSRLVHRQIDKMAFKVGSDG